MGYPMETSQGCQAHYYTTANLKILPLPRDLFSGYSKPGRYTTERPTQTAPVQPLLHKIADTFLSILILAMLNLNFLTWLCST